MKHFMSLLCLLMGTVFWAQAQSADDIIDKHLKALGGKDKLKSIQSVIMEGKVNSQGMEFPMTITIAHKKGFRLDFSVMGMDAWTIMRPDSGWSFMPFMGQTKPEAIPMEQIKEGESQLDLSSELCDYKEKGNMVEYLGLDDVEGTECHKLKATDKNGKITYYLIDPGSFLIVKSVSKQKAGGKEFEAETKFSNYKEVEGGFIFPHTMESMNGPVEMQKITVNAQIDDSKFKVGNY